MALEVEYQRCCKSLTTLSFPHRDLNSKKPILNANDIPYRGKSLVIISREKTFRHFVNLLSKIVSQLRSN